MSLKLTSALIAFIAAAILPPAVSAQQIVPAEEYPISGSCVVSLGSNVFRRENCMLGTEEAKVPNGFLMVIEHVSAACSTTPERGIYTLTLLVRTTEEGEVKMMHVPVRVQAATREQVRYTGSQMVRAYAGSGTVVGVLLSTFESAPAGATTCDVNFSGVVKRINQ